MADGMYYFYEIPDVPMSGCRTICTHARRYKTGRGTLYCPDCQCEWEWGVPERNPKAVPGWCMTPATIRMLSRLPRFQKRHWLDWLVNPDND